MRYYIADLHFYHENLNTRMDMRGFSSADEMNRYMIQKWNSKVRKNDEVVILGDFSMGKGKETNEIINQLNGTLYLVEGNHDRYLNDSEFNKERFVWIKPYAQMKDNNRKVILSHYPIFCYNGQYRYNKAGQPYVYMLYGHVHNSYDEVLVNHFQEITRQTKREILGRKECVNIPCNMINCFCMFSDYEPLTLDEWIVLDEKRRKNYKSGEEHDEHLI